MWRLLWLKWVFLLYLESDTLLPDPLPNLAHFFYVLWNLLFVGNGYRCILIFSFYTSFKLLTKLKTSLTSFETLSVALPFLHPLSWKKTQQGFLFWPPTPLIYYCHSATAPLISISLVIPVPVLFVTVNELQDTSVLLFNTGFFFPFNLLHYLVLRQLYNLLSKPDLTLGPQSETKGPRQTRSYSYTSYLCLYLYYHPSW